MGHFAVWCGIICLAVPVTAGPTPNTVEEKNVTFISAEASADGTSKITREIVEECIISLPAEKDLEAFLEAKVLFLKNVNGKVDDNQHVKTYTARIEIHYLIRQKELLIITTNTLQAKDPVIKEVEKTVRKVETVVSDPEEGDMFAEISPRKYFFTDPDKAAESAKKRARIWIKQHQGVVCVSQPQKQE